MGDSDSEGSDGEGGLGNVSRVIIRPPGTSGKAKRGHLCFDAAFETGNLGKAELIGDYEYDLYLRPDTCNPRYRFWFNFTVDNVRQDQRVIFNIVNISKAHNLLNAGFTPIVKSSSRPKWQRLPKRLVFYHRSPIHQNHHVLSFAFQFDKEDDVYQFAIASPYSYSRLQAYLNLAEGRQTDKRFKRSVLAKTLQNRNLDLITIDHVSGKEKAEWLDRNFMRVIVVLCRSHPSEAPASFACQGFIEFLLSNHPMARILREHFIFKIVPMVNPDGVFLGNNRCNLIGQDLNRSWNATTEFSHPTLCAIKDMLKEYDDSETHQIDFVIDLHATNSLEGCFIYGNTYEDVYRYERHLVFPRLFAANAFDYVAANAMFNADDRKSGTARRFCCDKLNDSVNAYTLEISIDGFYLKDGKSIALYTENCYYRCGRNLARTFLHYYRFINVLPASLMPEPRNKRRSRARAHHSRSRSKQRYEVQPRPKTERCYAPIAYTNLSIGYDSGGSTDDGGCRLSCSPKRAPLAPGSSYFSGLRHHHRSILQTHDQFSLLSLKSSSHRYDTPCMVAGRQTRSRSLGSKPKEKDVLPAKVAQAVPGLQQIHPHPHPHPHLSIIDLNQLTRGSLKPKAVSFDADQR